MKEAFRTDRATLRKPEMTPQGFLRVDGVIGRAGIYEYRNDDGSTRYELRPEDEVGSPEALESADAASMTVDHPVDEEVNADNVRRHEVGAVMGAARMDGRDVVASMIVKDSRAIKLVRAGKQQLSPGYKIRLDETPGADRRYAYPGNPEGRWDAIQRQIRVNHVAIVDRARGGSSVRLRMDSADRVDSVGKLTTIADGHQHLIETADECGVRMSGCTSWATSEGADQAHAHDWVRGSDGAITIGMSEGHTHSLLDAPQMLAPRADGQFDRLRTSPESGRMAQPPMDQDEQIRSLKAQLADAVAKLTPLTEAATKSAARADSADARAVTLAQENEELRAQIAAAATVVETEAIKREKIRADSAEEKLTRLDALRASEVDARVELVRKVMVVMGPDHPTAGVADRELVATVVKRLDSAADIGPHVSMDFLRGRFESLLERHARTARSHQILGNVITEQNQKRADSLDEKRAALRNQGLEPLPNDPRARKGA